MDIEFLLVLQGLRDAAGPTVTDIALAISETVGNRLLLLLPLILYWGFDKIAGRMICMSYGMTMYLNSLVKMTACVDRPFARDSRVTPPEGALSSATGYSFPSGHTQYTTSLWGAAGWYYRVHRWFLALVVAWCLLVGFTRLFLGVHTPQDVLCGLALGMLTIFFAYRVTLYLERDDARPNLVFVGGLIIGVAAFLFLLFKPYPEGTEASSITINACLGASYYFGVLIGWYLEQRFVNFSNDGPVRDKVIRVVVGLVLTIGVYNLAGLVSGLGIAELVVFLPAFSAAVVGLWAAPAVSELIISKL